MQAALATVLATWILFTMWVLWNAQAQVHARNAGTS